jgi:uncharacterized delta-60 repeat protein
MRRRRKRTPELRQSRFVQPRLEALEDRFLPSGNPLGPTVTATITSLNLYPQQELVLPDGKILLGVTIETVHYLGMQYSGSVSPSLIMGRTWQFATAMELVRLNADGTPDTTFGHGGVDILRPDLSDSFANFAVAADGSILVAGTEVSSNAGYLLTSPESWPQYSSNAGSPGYDFVYQDSGLRVLRLKADGSIDSGFQAGNVPGFRVDTMEADGSVGAVAVQAGGKVVVAGEEEGFGNSTIFVARYNADGSFDTTFNPGGARAGVATTSITNRPVNADPSDYGYGRILSVAVQGDGKIVVGGNQSAYGEMLVLQYNADGSADTGFGTNGMVSYSAGPGEFVYFRSLALQADGKIVAEATLRAGGVVLVRLNTDGTFDSSFGQQGVVQSGTSANPAGPYTVYQAAFASGENIVESPVEANLVFDALVFARVPLIVQADGKIVVAGAATADLTGHTDKYTEATGFVARFNADGSPDTTFGANGVQLTTLVANESKYETVDPLAIGLAPDGSVLVVGKLDYGLRGARQGSTAMVQYLVLLDFQDGTTGGGNTASPVAALPAAPTSNALADAVFQLLASGGSVSNAGSAALPETINLFDLPTTLPSTITPLPIPGVSQSAAVAGLSGGGGGLGTAIDDPFALTGEPDRINDLVLAGDANGAA